jgi:hypothetical protein
VRRGNDPAGGLGTPLQSQNFVGRSSTPLTVVEDLQRHLLRCSTKAAARILARVTIRSTTLFPIPFTMLVRARLKPYNQAVLA